MPTRLAAAAALILATLIGLGPVAPEPADPLAATVGSAYKRCRDVTIRNTDGSIYTATNGLVERHTACALARLLARHY